MSRINLIHPAAATGKAKELLDAVQAKMGLVPNMTRAMANSPAVLEGYLALSGAVTKGVLPSKLRQQIALAVGQRNECNYCLAAHSAIAKMVGLTSDQIDDSRHGSAVEPKADATLRLANAIVDSRGRISDEQLSLARKAGLDDADIAEVVANVALNIFTNYFNQVADTEIDFPRTAPLSELAGR